MKFNDRRITEPITCEAEKGAGELPKGVSKEVYERLTIEQRKLYRLGDKNTRRKILESLTTEK